MLDTSMPDFCWMDSADVIQMPPIRGFACALLSGRNSK